MGALVEPGDPNAPMGTRSWCVALHSSTLLRLNEGNFAVQRLKVNLQLFRERGFYRQLLNDQNRPFRSWEEFVQFREPFGLGLHLEAAEAILPAR